MRQHVREVAVVGEDQQPACVAVEATDVVDAGRVVARELAQVGTALVVLHGRDNAGRLVQQHVAHRLVELHGRAVDLDPVALRVHPRSELRDRRAVDRHATRDDVLLAHATRGDARVREGLLQAHRTVDVLGAACGGIAGVRIRGGLVPGMPPIDAGTVGGPGHRNIGEVLERVSALRAPLGSLANGLLAGTVVAFGTGSRAVSGAVVATALRRPALEAARGALAALRAIVLAPLRAIPALRTPVFTPLRALPALVLTPFRAVAALPAIVLTPLRAVAALRTPILTPLGTLSAPSLGASPVAISALRAPRAAICALRALRELASISALAALRARASASYAAALEAVTPAASPAGPAAAVGSFTHAIHPARHRGAARSSAAHRDC
ncbi:hypothetical protein GCM10011490_00150 [Pseudoclavibacter endophyticus]|nr:hypothetical protein GCM10011490_00150 [Pseudoclavibacter endophyticus]